MDKQTDRQEDRQVVVVDRISLSTNALSCLANECRNENSAEDMQMRGN